MPFQKGNRLWDNPKTKATQIKKGQHLSPETEIKKGSIRSDKWFQVMKSRTGELNPSWKGGLEKRKVSEKKHLCSKYVIWMKEVKNRDDWKCKIGNNDCIGRIEAHHILPWRNFPELRYEKNNGITLCTFHHPKKYAEEIRLSPMFQELIQLEIIES